MNPLNLEVWCLLIEKPRVIDPSGGKTSIAFQSQRLDVCEIGYLWYDIVSFSIVRSVLYLGMLSILDEGPFV